jgi:hypothetical protein
MLLAGQIQSAANVHYFLSKLADSALGLSKTLYLSLCTGLHFLGVRFITKLKSNFYTALTSQDVGYWS